MTSKDKFLSALRYKSDARLPIVHFGFWYETVIKWIDVRKRVIYHISL